MPRRPKPGVTGRADGAGAVVGDRDGQAVPGRSSSDVGGRGRRVGRRWSAPPARSGTRPVDLGGQVRARDRRSHLHRHAGRLRPVGRPSSPARPARLAVELRAQHVQRRRSSRIASRLASWIASSGRRAFLAVLAARWTATPVCTLMSEMLWVSESCRSRAMRRRSSAARRRASSSRVRSASLGPLLDLAHVGLPLAERERGDAGGHQPARGVEPAPAAIGPHAVSLGRRHPEAHPPGGVRAAYARRPTARVLAARGSTAKCLPPHDARRGRSENHRCLDNHCERTPMSTCDTARTDPVPHDPQERPMSTTHPLPSHFDATAPGDAGYDQARRTFSAAGSPDLVVRPRSPTEVGSPCRWPWTPVRRCR